MRKIIIFIVFLGQFGFAQSQTFVHPGVLHDQKDFDLLKSIVQHKSGVAYLDFLLLKNNSRASADYQMNGPYQTIARDGEFAWTKSKMESDFSAAYLNAIMWIATQDSRHADKSLQILEAYAEKLKTIPNTNDSPLLAGLEGFKIIYATEILKYTYKGASTDQIDKITLMFNQVFMPVLEGFYHRAAYTNGNWGAIVTKTYLAAAIYMNNRAMYRMALDFYEHAEDNGSIRNYIDAETGQIQESGRDQGHSQLGIGALATICEEAWKQGDDLYASADNRLLKGFEYVARYNLCDDQVPYRTWSDITGKYSSWTVISTQGRGKFYPIYEMAYHHYVKRKGAFMPYTKKVIDQVKLEDFDRDQPAFGTFLFSN